MHVEDSAKGDPADQPDEGVAPPLVSIVNGVGNQEHSNHQDSEERELAFPVWTSARCCQTLTQETPQD